MFDSQLPSPPLSASDTGSALLHKQFLVVLEALPAWQAQQIELQQAQLDVLTKLLHTAGGQALRFDVGVPTSSGGESDPAFVCCEGEVPDSNPKDLLSTRKHTEHQEVRDGIQKEEQSSYATLGTNPTVASAKAQLAHEMGSIHAQARLVDGWKQSSGLHTVSTWVQNYKKHPAGWAALLMIHGIPEVTNRLRHKVENFAIYSALFLSMSIAMLASPPEIYFENLEEHTYTGKWWVHWIRMTVYLCGFAIGTGAHYTCILLGMAFTNALNEAARDSDVYRLFARGKGFLATKKCQMCFHVGCCADFIAVCAAMCFYAHAALVVLLIVSITGLCVWIYFPTKQLLFSSASIVNYWREELGGKPDKDDLYDLPVVLHSFQRREAFEKLLAETVASHGGSCLDLDAEDMPKALRPSLSSTDPSDPPVCFNGGQAGACVSHMAI